MTKVFTSGFAAGLVALSALVSTTTHAAPVTLDFEDQATFSNTNLPQGYGGLTWDTGVPDSWGGVDGKWMAWSDASYAAAHSGTTYLFNGYGPKDLGFTLAAPTDGVSAWFARTTNGTDPSPIQLIAYVGDTPTYFSDALILDSTPQMLSVFGEGITRVVVHGNSAAWYAMDDLTISGAVPESPTVVNTLIGLGLIGGLMAVRRRGQHSA